MKYVADLHFHSKYSRAVSQDMVLPVISEWAKKKGLDILTTADWTHPLWFREIRNQLEEYSEGVYRLKSSRFAKASRDKQVGSTSGESRGHPRGASEPKETLFLLTTEISSIYSQGGKTRRIHNLVFAPDFETVGKINQELIKRGCNLTSDGRPIIGLPSKYLLELLLSINDRIILIPCHAWTPWFSLYGSNSGFDSIEKCFENYSKYIYAVETGLSSDPEMNWRIKELDGKSIVSFSDAHSPAKMGREATVFELQGASYENVRKAIMQLSVFGSQLSDSGQSVVGQSVTDKQITDKLISENRKQKTDNRISFTIEFYPEEGKYHYTGHRNCKVVQNPDETKEKGVICPVCHRSLTVGVMHRVEELANKDSLSVIPARRFVEASPLGRKAGIQKKTWIPDQVGDDNLDDYGVKWIGDPSGKHPPYVKLVPMLEIVAESLDMTVNSIRVKSVFDDLCSRFGSELNVLLSTNIQEIEKFAGSKIAEGIRKVRNGDISIIPGFDGEYGKVQIWEKKPEKETNSPQLSLDF